MPPADTAADKPDRVAEAAAAYESAPVEQDPAVAGAQTLERLREHGFDRNQARGVVYAVRALAGDLSARGLCYIPRTANRPPTEPQPDTVVQPGAVVTPPGEFHGPRRFRRR